MPSARPGRRPRTVPPAARAPRDPVVARDGTAGGCFSGGFRTIAEVQEAEDQVVGVLVLVPVLKGEGLEDGVRQHVGDSDT